MPNSAQRQTTPEMKPSDPDRETILWKLMVAQEELKTAGKIHRRDLIRHINRLKNELLQYDRVKAGNSAERMRHLKQQ